MLILFCFIIEFLLAWSCVYLFRRYALYRGLIDHPNARSSHTIPTPRGGGLIIVMVWLLFLLIFTVFFSSAIKNLFIFLPGILVALIGYLDDKYSLAARWRFLVQFFAAILSITVIGGIAQFDLGNIVINLSWFGSVLALLMLIWSTNLFNFMDGIDGIAGIEALFVFGVGGIIFWHYGANDLTILSCGVAVASLGFLYWNWPLAKIFMGDVGSGFLGFLVMLFAIVGQKQYGIPIIIWFILYAIFIFDATITLVRRVLARQRWYEAHKLHAYQRLNQVGWNHLQVLLGAIIINLCLSLFAVAGAYFVNNLWWLTLSAYLLIVAIYLLIEYKKPMFT